VQTWIVPPRYFVGRSMILSYYVNRCLHYTPGAKGHWIKIDTEWRSDWKWDRIAPHLNLDGQQVLDIGCGNGYFGLRMLGAGARLVVGIDPTMVFVMQWLAMQKLAPGLNNFVLPMGIEHLSMGVLYHRRDPLEHLRQLRSLVRTGGHIVLETLVLDGAGKEVLEPQGRYARMRNVHAVPTVAVLLEWLKQAGMANAEVLDVSKTTVEGHPAPVRAALLVKV